MAKQVITTILDDLDGSEADESVTFALDGVGYEIDLSGKHASELRTFLATYMDAGTRTGRVDGRYAQVSKYTSTATKVQDLASRDYNQKVRLWAQQNGWPLSDRGRIPQTVVDAFESKTPNPEWAAGQEASKKVEDEVANRPPTRTRRRNLVPPAFADKK